MKHMQITFKIKLPLGEYELLNQKRSQILGLRRKLCLQQRALMSLTLRTMVQWEIPRFFIRMLPGLTRPARSLMLIKYASLVLLHLFPSARKRPRLTQRNQRYKTKRRKNGQLVNSVSHSIRSCTVHCSLPLVLKVCLFIRVFCLVIELMGVLS